MYTEEVNEHFQNPRNQGIIEDADIISEVSNENLGDSITLYLKIKDDRIDNIKYEIFGCPAAIATSSKLTELVMGKTLDEALTVTKYMVSDALGGLPERKLECSTVSIQALQEAIQEYKA